MNHPLETEPINDSDRQLLQEDQFAGKLLGVMLTGFFIYTIVTSIGILWWMVA